MRQHGQQPTIRPHHLALAPLLALALATAPAFADDPEYSGNFDRSRCTFTSVGNNPYFPLLPGAVLHFAGEEDDEGEIVEVTNVISVLDATEMVDGVETRVIEERESKDGELVEISHNFFALCRETGDVWYFGEDVDIYEDGVVVAHDGAWRTGENGATAGIIMPGTPILGARAYQEQAPGVALDRGEFASVTSVLTVPAGTFDHVVRVDETTELVPGDLSQKWYAPGIGLIKDDVLELEEREAPPCEPSATALCLGDGRFRVTADWQQSGGASGHGTPILAAADAGEFWFFRADNTELLVKVLDACQPPFAHFWVFAAGLTNVGVTLTVTDTATGAMKVYTNPVGADFAPILDTTAFDTCP